MKGWIYLLMTFFMGVTSMNAAKTQNQISSGIFNPKTITLSNGLQIILIENHLAPVVSVNLLYKVGTVDDSQEMYGISHFLEHLMFKGTKKTPAGQFKKIISENGGIINAMTTPEYTVYTCDIGLEFLDSYFALEADRMENLVMEPDGVIAEQKVVQEERLMRLDNNPLGSAYEALLRASFWHHPYGTPTIGYPQHIAAYTREAACDHYKKWYVPNNAVLIVAGDIKMETLTPMVEKHFGKIPTRALPQRKRVVEPDHKGVVISLEQENPRISQINLTWQYASPSHRSDGSVHYYPLIILSQVLGGNNISRFYRNLVEEKKLAVSASCSYDGDDSDALTFNLSATLAPEKALYALETAIHKEIDDLVKNGISEKELMDAKRDLLAALAFSRDGNNTSARAFCRLGLGFTIEQIENWPSQIEAVTLEQVQKAAEFVLGKLPVAKMTVYPIGGKEIAKKQEEADLKKSLPEEKEKKI